MLVIIMNGPVNELGAGEEMAGPGLEFDGAVEGDAPDCVGDGCGPLELAEMGVSTIKVADTKEAPFVDWKTVYVVGAAPLYPIVVLPIVVIELGEAAGVATMIVAGFVPLAGRVIETREVPLPI